MFVGGINLDNDSVTTHPFRSREGEFVSHTQDVYCELAGPVGTGVHHNFVQRWNGASEQALALGAWPAPDRVDDLDALAMRADENRARQAAGEPIRGHSIALDAAVWGVESS